MADNEVQYDHRSEKVIRGTEARAITKAEADGWELEDRIPGTLRTELRFRKVKPQTGPNIFTRAWTAFRGLAPKTQGTIAGVCGFVVLLAVGALIFAGMRSNRSDDVAAQPVQSATPSPSPTATPSSEVTTANSSATDSPTPQNLTTQNNAELAALLTLPDNCSGKVGAFAHKYNGEQIEFNGNIVSLDNHGTYQTRYDVLVAPGNYSTTHQIGPTFQFNNVNIYNLNLKGADSLREGDNVHLVAKVGDYNPNSCLFQLDPVSTTAR